LNCNGCSLGSEGVDVEAALVASTVGTSDFLVLCLDAICTVLSDYATYTG